MIIPRAISDNPATIFLNRSEIVVESATFLVKQLPELPQLQHEF